MARFGMNLALAAALFAAACSSEVQQADAEQTPASEAATPAAPPAPINDLPNPYKSVDNWVKLPDGRTWGSTAGVDIDPDGKSVWALDRCGSNSCAGSNVSVVNKFDPSGKFIRGFGGGMFIFPHGMHVDREGNVWVTDGRAATPEELKKFPDAKGKGHTVVKFSPEGKLVLTLGKPGVAGTEPGARFRLALPPASDEG